jgi:hypothetical protein
MDEMKRCPACAEEVQAAAVKCRFCGTILVPTEWVDSVLSWRRLQQWERDRYFQNLDQRQQATFRALDAVLPRTAPLPSGVTSGVPATGETIICPNPQCGYQGPSQRVPRGSTAVGCILLLFFLVPGILYFMFRSGYRYVCPKCGLQIRADN